MKACSWLRDGKEWYFFPVDEILVAERSFWVRDWRGIHEAAMSV